MSVYCLSVTVFSLDFLFCLFCTCYMYNKTFPLGRYMKDVITDANFTHLWSHVFNERYIVFTLTAAIVLKIRLGG